MQGVVTSAKAPLLPQVECYPNPVQSTLQLKSPHAAWLRIYNVLGSLQHEEFLTTGTVAIPVANWAPGMYLLRLESKQGVFTFRFQKHE